MSENCIIEHPDGVELSVKAQPNSKKNEVRGIQNGALKVCVTQVAEKGKANKAVIKELSKFFGLRTSQFELISGGTSPQKKFLIRNTDIQTLHRKLQEIIDNTESNNDE